MNIILSRRGRDIKAKVELKRCLEEKYMITKLPLSKDEQERVRRVFDDIRRQLGIRQASREGLICQTQS